VLPLVRPAELLELGAAGSGMPPLLPVEPMLPPP
jgi:hypothetical protein